MNPFREFGIVVLLNVLVGGFALLIRDRTSADPPAWLERAHPRRLVAMLSSYLEGALRERMGFELRAAGAVMAITTAAMVVAAVALLSLLGPVARMALMFLAMSTSKYPVRAMWVDKALRRHDLSVARARVGAMTEWDTDRMSEQEVSGAAIESLALGVVDATAAPLLYMAIGSFLGIGPALGWLWLTVLTLYRRVGGEGAAYVDFGAFTRSLYRALVRPADWILACLTVPASLWFDQSARCAARGLRARHRGESAILAATAGALRVRLGGDVRKGGVVLHRRVLGSEQDAVQPLDVRLAVELIGAACSTVIFLLVLVAGLFR